jgi:ribosomal protein S18 acetylase RimI-like enzyme
VLSEPQRDDWLSDVLGFDAWVVTPESAGYAHAPGLYTCRVPTADLENAGLAADNGFRVVDVNVTLERRGGESFAGDAVAPATPDQHDALLDIAGSCFRYSRFHLDPGIPRPLADRVKREWVRSFIEGRRGIELLAATAGDEPLGFLAVLETVDDARVIDLVGVAPHAQGRGIGQALVANFAHRHGNGTRILRVGTQASNVPSLRLYEKLGFRVVSSAYVLHRHVGA